MDLMNGGGTAFPTRGQTSASPAKRNAGGKPQIALSSAAVNILRSPPTDILQSGRTFLIVQQGRRNSCRNHKVAPGL